MGGGNQPPADGPCPRPRMSKSCEGLIKEVAKCVARSECIRAGGKSAKQCVREAPPECDNLRHQLVQCKTGQVNMRNRIRGNKGY